MVSIKQIKRDSAKAARAAAKVIKQRNKPVTFYGPLLPGNRYKASEVLPQRMETYISRNKRLVQMKHTKGIQYMNVPHGPFLLRVIDSKSHPHNYYNTKAASVWADHDDILPVSLGNYNKKRKIGYYNYNPYTGAEKAEIKKIYDDPTLGFTYKDAERNFKLAKKMTAKQNKITKKKLKKK